MSLRIVRLSIKYDIPLLVKIDFHHPVAIHKSFPFVHAPPPCSVVQPMLGTLDRDVFMVRDLGMDSNLSWCVRLPCYSQKASRQTHIRYAGQMSLRLLRDGDGERERCSLHPSLSPPLFLSCLSSPISCAIGAGDAREHQVLDSN